MYSSSCGRAIDGILLLLSLRSSPHFFFHPILISDCEIQGFVRLGNPENFCAHVLLVGCDIVGDVHNCYSIMVVNMHASEMRKGKSEGKSKRKSKK